MTAAAAKQAITNTTVASRCIRAGDPRARIARAVTVRFALALAGEVALKLERWTDKAGQAKCPPPQGDAPAGKRPPGTYSPFTSRTVAGKAGRNTVTLATTGRSRNKLRRGTYLLTMTAGGVAGRAKLWVLDQN